MVVVRLEKWHFEPAGSSEANNLNSQLTCARQQFVVSLVMLPRRKLCVTVDRTACMMHQGVHAYQSSS